MVEEVAKFLITRRDGIYLDLTSGGGGHLKYISEFLSEKAVLVGVDRDPEAVAVARKNLKTLPQKSSVINNTYIRLEDVMRELGSGKIDGVLMDLGLSSHQLDSPERGFSYLNDGPLDMRMGSDCELTAEDVINDYSREKLTFIFKQYGEEKRAGRAATAICRQRRNKRIDSTIMLKKILEPVLSPKYMSSSLARIFQALRIEINNELTQLKEVLPKALSFLEIGGHLVIISYHSLEDRIVKRFFAEKARGCICPEKFPVCVCGHKPEVKLLTKRIVKPSRHEADRNSRARSAKLRAAEKIA
jgi:16S rRNA (cytosine1402-N4)-methyltransferase